MSKFSKLAIAVTSSVIIIPYTVVFMSEWIYSRKSLVSILKSLSPTRVISYTEIFLKELYLYKYLGTFIKSIRYYAHVASDHIVKVFSDLICNQFFHDKMILPKIYEVGYILFQRTYNMGPTIKR